jgi:hypothetical protein
VVLEIQIIAHIRFACGDARLTLQIFAVAVESGESVTITTERLIPAITAIMVVTNPIQLATQEDDKDSNRRISFFEQSEDLAPGQLYSTESGRYFAILYGKC